MLQLFDPMEYKSVVTIAEVYKTGYFSFYNWTRGLEAMSSDIVISVGGYNYENLKIWKIPEFTLMKEIKNPGAGGIIIIRKVDEKLFLTGGYYADVKLWTLDGYCVKKIYEKEHREFIEEIALLGNRKFLTCSRDSTIKLWNLD